MADIKRRIVLEGEKEYNAALKEAQRNLKTLKSELKAETAELGANATAQQKNETRAKSLQKQIREQEKVVKTLKAALEEAKEEYGDNEEVVAKWEQKLNDARTTLANMKNGLEGTNQAVKNTGSSMKEAANSAAETVTATKNVVDALNQIGTVGDSVAGAIENVFSGIISTIEQTVSAAWELINETAAKANDWTDIAGYWNTDAQTIQQYARAVSASANSFEDLNAAVSKIVLGGKGKKITELIGISDVNYKNDWDYAMAVMNRMFQMIQSGKDMTPIYEEIFGEKRATKMMDLLNDWGEIQRNLKTFNGNESGYGMNNEELETMDQLWIDINRLEEKYDALKDKFAAGLGTLTGSLLVNVEGGLDALADFMAAETPEEREAALENLRTNVEEFFRKTADILREGIKILNDVGTELQESDDPLTAMIGDILVKLTSSLGWLVDHQDAVKGAFEAIFGVWLIAKLGAVAGQLGNIILQIETIKAFQGISIAGAGAAGAAGAGAAGAGAGTAAAGVAGAVAKAVPVAAGMYVALKPAEGDAQEDSFYVNGIATRAAKEAGLPDTQAEFEAWTDEQKATWSQENAWKPPEQTKAEPETQDTTKTQKTPGVPTGSMMKIEPAVADVYTALKEAEGGAQGDSYYLNGRVTRAGREAGLPDTQAEFDAWTDEQKAAWSAGTVWHPEPEEQPQEEQQPQSQDNAEDIAEMLRTALQNATNSAMQMAGGDAQEDSYYYNGQVTRAGREAGLPDTQAEFDAWTDEQKAAWSAATMWHPETETQAQSAVETAEMVEEGVREALEGITEEQRTAAEAFWDAYREWATSEDGDDTAFDEAYDQYEAAFTDMPELFAKIDSLIDKLVEDNEDWTHMENLPASWWLDAASWQGKGSQITSADLQQFRGMPENVAKAVGEAAEAGAAAGTAKGISGITVYLDGYAVGKLVAPYVSEEVGRDIII